MYIPAHFAEDRPEELHRIMRAHPLGLLCTAGPDGLDANHLPFHLDPATGPHGTLLARIFHRSRATNEYGIALVCPKIQVSNLDQRAGNAEAKLYRRN